MEQLYKDYAAHLSEHFDGKVQKITLNIGLSCPNRDGRIGRGGCIYCNNKAFSPAYAMADMAVEEQIEAGRRFFARKYPTMRYLAYFQSYTNTYGDVGRLVELYRRALSCRDVVGLVIGTRPDCLPDVMIEALASLDTSYVMIELGAESMHDTTLARINRCHTAEVTADAVRRVKSARLHAGVHLIMGLPGEDEAMMADSVRQVCALGIDTLKMHQLQILRGSMLEAMYAADPTCVHLFEPEEYAALCARLVRLCPHEVAIERFTAQAPAEMIVGPRWGMKNHEFVHLVRRHLMCQKGLPTMRQ